MKVFSLIVDAPDGAQDVIEVEESGSYFDKSRVVWDERQDAPLDGSLRSRIGGLVRQGGSLEFSPDRHLLHVDTVKKRGEVAARTDLAREGLSEIDTQSINSVEELKDAVERILAYLKTL